MMGIIMNYCILFTKNNKYIPCNLVAILKKTKFAIRIEVYFF